MESKTQTEQGNTGKTLAEVGGTRCGGVRLPDAAGQVIFWLLAAGGLGLDLWTKKAIFERLGPKESIQIIDGVVRFVEAVNDGAAFSIASGRARLLMVVAIAALAVILGMFYIGGIRRRGMQAALGLFAAGVCGNLWDRLFNGGLVRDFIDVVYWPGRHWPTFNVADVLLCVAVGLLLIENVFTGWSGRRRDPQRK